MQNKSNFKKRDDIKVIITAVALSLTLAFWNLFSTVAQKPVPTTNLEPTVSPMPQVRILLGGPPPKTTIFVSKPNVAPKRNQQRAPQPITKTRSSK